MLFNPISKTIVAVDDLNTPFNLKHLGSDIILFDQEGKVVTKFGRSGSYSGPKTWYHDITIDADENIYVGDILGNTLQKFSKVKK